MDDKIKVLNVFQNDETTKDTDKLQFPNKFEFEKGVIRNAIVSGSNYKLLKVDIKEKKKCIIFREECEYCLTNYSISGNLILTKESLFFEPDLRDKNVIVNGLGSYQIFIDLYDIYECAHIVVPTKDTYLYNNEETCGFIQVLLKSTYNKMNNDSAFNKTCSNNSQYINNNAISNNLQNNNNINNSKNDNGECNKHKSISYYKYISKSLSFVYNLAQPLVHNTLNKEYKSHKFENNDSVGIPTDTEKQNDKNKSDQNDESLLIKNKKKNNFINFDINSKNNIVDHLRDSDLKIYQKINETDYSTVSSSDPIITYKNNLNLVNSSYFHKKDDSIDNAKKREFHNFNKIEYVNKFNPDINGKISANNNFNETHPNNEKWKSIHQNNIEKRKNIELKTIPTGSEQNNINKVNASEANAKSYAIQSSISSNNEKENSFYTQNDSGNTTKNFSTNLLNEGSYLKKINNKIEIKIGNYLKKKTQKSHEEKSFILFKFFNNNKAYETTIKIIKEIDEIRKSENKIKKTITSVPFTSNELLRYIIEQSLNTDDSKKTKIVNPLNDTKDVKYQVMIPKLEYINGSAKLLNKEAIMRINYYLPPTLSIKSWKMAFCSSIHGVSFKTLYNSVYNKGSVIILIYDMDNVLFGYFSDKLHCDNCYYGSGQNFLFTLKNSDSKLQKDVTKKIYANSNTRIIDNPETFEKNVHLNSYDTEKTFKEIEQDELLLENNKMKNTQNNCFENENPSDKAISHIENNSNEPVDACSSISDDTLCPINHLNTINMHISNTSNQIHREKIVNKETVNSLYQINSYNNNEHLFTKENYLPNNDTNNSNSQDADNGSIKFFTWTTKNNYFIYSDERSIMIGGGDNYALVINEGLSKGLTNKSNTYDNDLLTYNEEFEIQFLQLWIFDDY